MSVTTEERVQHNKDAPAAIHQNPGCRSKEEQVTNESQLRTLRLRDGSEIKALAVEMNAPKLKVLMVDAPDQFQALLQLAQGAEFSQIDQGHVQKLGMIFPGIRDGVLKDDYRRIILNAYQMGDNGPELVWPAIPETELDREIARRFESGVFMGRVREIMADPMKILEEPSSLKKPEGRPGR